MMNVKYHTTINQIFSKIEANKAFGNLKYILEYYNMKKKNNLPFFNAI